MTDPATETEPILYRNTFVVPDGYSRAAANAFVTFSLRRPLAWIPLIVIALADVALWLSAAFDGASDLVPIYFLVILVLIPLRYLLQRNSLAKRLALGARPGAIYELSLAATTVSIRTPMASSSVLYGYYERVDQRGDFLLLKIRGARIRSIVPRPLLTDEWLAWMRAQIER